MAAFCAHAASRAWRPARRRRAAGSPVRCARRACVTLMLVFLLLGATFGSIEVAVPVAAEAAGHAGSAGLLLGVWGFGSLLGGLAAARAGAAADPVRRLTVLLAALAAGHLLLTLTTGLLPLAGLLLLAGLALSPAMAVAFAMVEGLAPPGTVTEAYTWLTTGIAAGPRAGRRRVRRARRGARSGRRLRRGRRRVRRGGARGRPAPRHAHGVTSADHVRPPSSERWTLPSSVAAYSAPSSSAVSACGSPPVSPRSSHVSPPSALTFTGPPGSIR